MHNIIRRHPVIPNRNMDPPLSPPKYNPMYETGAHNYCLEVYISRKYLYSTTHYFNLYNAELISYKSWRSNGFNQFEIIIKVLDSSFWFIWIPMLWVYGHYRYFYSYSAGTDFSRQNLTSTDVGCSRIVRPSVRPAVRLSVCPSVCWSGLLFFQIGG